MSQHSEGYFSGYQDYKLYFQKWENAGSQLALIITHGQAEHSGCYHRLIAALKELPITVYAWDMRGHGRSQGLRGYADQFEDYCRDFDCFLKFLEQDAKFKSKKRVLLSHSMGGLVQLKTILDYQPKNIMAQVLSAPLLGISVQVPAYKDIGAALLLNFMPKLTLWNEIRYQDLTRDQDIIKEYETDVLRHDRISSGVYIGSQTAYKSVKERASRFVLPTLMQIPVHDPVVSSDENRKFFTSLKSVDKKLIEYADRKHEIYNDLDNDVVFKDVKEFLLKHI